MKELMSGMKNLEYKFPKGKVLEIIMKGAGKKRSLAKKRSIHH